MEKIKTSQIKECVTKLEKVKKEIKKAIIDQDEAIDYLLIALLTNNHILVEGVPGIAKTLLVRVASATIGCDFKRISFTVDLLPTDITGMLIYEPNKGFSTVKGPIFTNFLLADEINRSPPKTQSSLLEAMQERQVTIGKTTYKLEKPFLVMATQNPIEEEGVYSLPAAEVDRFLLKIIMKYTSLDKEKIIIDENLEMKDFKEYNIKTILNKNDIIKLQTLTKKVFISDKIKNYITRIVDSTRNPNKYKINLGKYIEYGASPRASIGLALAARAYALINGRNFVTDQDIKNIAHGILRHRIILNYEGMAKNISTDDIIEEILSKIEIISTK